MITEKRCPKCELVKPVSEFYERLGNRHGLSVYCKPCYRENMQGILPRRREAVVALLGGKCAACGYSADVRALHIDHINGDGYEHRSKGGALWTYRDITNDPDRAAKYQVLCANCNHLKRVERKEHHKSGREKLPRVAIDPIKAQQTPAGRVILSESFKALWRDPETRARILEGQAESRSNGRFDQAAISVKVKSYWKAHPEELAARNERISATKREVFGSGPKVERKSRSEANALKWQDPEYRAKWAASRAANPGRKSGPPSESRKAKMAALWADPEYRERVLAARKAGKKSGPKPKET